MFYWYPFYLCFDYCKRNVEFFNCYYRFGDFSFYFCWCSHHICWNSVVGCIHRIGLSFWWINFDLYVMSLFIPAHIPCLNYMFLILIILSTLFWLIFLWYIFFYMLWSECVFSKILCWNLTANMTVLGDRDTGKILDHEGSVFMRLVPKRCPRLLAGSLSLCEDMARRLWKLMPWSCTFQLLEQWEINLCYL